MDLKWQNINSFLGSRDGYGSRRERAGLEKGVRNYFVDEGCVQVLHCDDISQRSTYTNSHEIVYRENVKFIIHWVYLNAVFIDK